MQVTFKIFRCNPEQGAKPYYQNFTFEMRQGATVLDGLVEIKNYHDGNLTFRHSCHSAICGSCAMCINGHSSLACKTQIGEVAKGGTVIVEPLRYQRVIKDLVVDSSPFWDKYATIRPWVVPAPTVPPPEKEYRITPEEVTATGAAETCIQCGACYSSCPLLLLDPDYLGPAALLAAYRFVVDPRDSIRPERLRIVNQPAGVWRCHTVFNCGGACPKGINPTWAIGRLKAMIVLEKLRGRL
jgi:succinate dehydrogenase / fumarate reductase iron-sulfur subunit